MPRGEGLSRRIWQCSLRTATAPRQSGHGDARRPARDLRVEEIYLHSEAFDPRVEEIYLHFEGFDPRVKETYLHFEGFDPRVKETYPHFKGFDPRVDRVEPHLRACDPQGRRLRSFAAQPAELAATSAACGAQQAATLVS